MADIDCNSEMKGFHRTEVTLLKSQQDDMRKRRDAGRTRLETGLERNDHRQPKEKASQGSYQMRTMVQDDESDYDIDDGVYFEKENLVDSDGNALAPKAARERVCKALEQDDRLAHKAKVKRNCVRQEYPEGYHIDVPVYRIVTTRNDKDEEVKLYELASGDEWIESDARAVTRWFNDMVGELNAGESDGSQMRRVTKLTKKLARSRKDWKAKTTSGICITKLLTDHFESVEDRDDKTLRETWKCIKKKLDTSTEIEHPVLDEPLAKSGDAEVEFFRDCLNNALEKLEVLDNGDCDRKKARAAWDDVFNTTYFTDRPDDDGKGKNTESLVVTSVETARRDDGGGRFG